MHKLIHILFPVRPYRGLFILFLATAFSAGTIAPLNAQTSPIPVHDPVMIQQDSTYYLYATGWGISVWSSPDRKNWERREPVFRDPPPWADTVVPDFRNHLWAPDISFRNGKYYLYYSVSSFGSNRSAIGVATNTTLNPDAPGYRWVDHGPVVQSVPGRDLWNAIDPNLTFDEDGTPWLSFGSYWRGLKIVKLNETMTAIARDPQRWHTIAARHRYWKLPDRYAGDTENGDIEAPFIFKKAPYYYLFASWDRCCAGENSTYKIVVGRSKQITGPYYDRSGKEMTFGGGTLVAKGTGKWAAVGHPAAYSWDDKDYLVFHGYDRSDEGRSKLIIEPIRWEDGWPQIEL